MIYYSAYNVEYLQNIMGLVSNEYELASNQLELSFDEANKVITKWVDRYDLLNTPQQTYRKRLNEQPVFSLSVCLHFSYKNEDQTMVERFKEMNEIEDIVDFRVVLQLFCRTSDAVLNHEELDRVLSPKNNKDIPLINEKLGFFVKNAEKFHFIGDLDIQKNGYELIRTTKPKKSIKELNKNNWTKTAHATDWTWRLNEKKLDTQVQQGKRIFLRFQNLLERNASLGEKKAYFEKHFRALEGYLGYRGVRQQIGTIYHQEKKLFKSKYNKDFFEQGGRALKLSYVKKQSNTIANNSEINKAFDHYKSIVRTKTRKAFDAELEKNVQNN